MSSCHGGVVEKSYPKFALSLEGSEVEELFRKTPRARYEDNQEWKAIRGMKKKAKKEARSQVGESKRDQSQQKRDPLLERLEKRLEKSKDEKEQNIIKEYFAARKARDEAEIAMEKALKQLDEFDKKQAALRK